MAEISMTVLDIYKLETDSLRKLCRAFVIVDDVLDLVVSKDGIAFVDADSSIEKRVVVENAWLSFSLFVRTTETTGMRELKSNEKIVHCAASLLVC